MKKIITITLAVTCLLGCKKELHDSVLRQELTATISSLDDQNKDAAAKAYKDIDAILSVNSAKMSQEQKDKLSSAEVLLSEINVNFSKRDLNASLHPNDTNPPDNNLDDIGKVKTILSEAAASF